MNTEGGDESIKYSERSIAPFETYIEHLLSFLKYLRVLRKENTFSLSKIFLITFAIAVLLSANVLLVISEILLVPGNLDIERLANTINPLGLHISGLVKWIYCLCKSKEINELVTDLDRCYSLSKKIDSSNECDLPKIEMENVCKNSRMWLYGWVTVCVYGTVQWCFNALFQKLYNNQIDILENDTLVYTSPLPYITWQPWSIETGYGYASTFLIQFVGAVSSAIGVSCYDSLHVSIFMVLCGQLQCLHLLLIDIDSVIGTREIEEKLEKKLRYCVDHHTAILKISRDLETFANLPMFIQCIETIIIICLLSFEMSTVQFNTDSESMMKLFSLMEYFSAVSLQLYVFCFYATRIYFLSLRIADSVYACGWELAMYDKIENTSKNKQLSIKMRHSLLLFLLRAQNPIIMTGGPFYILSLETFKSVMSLAVSNAIILRQLSER
ncbi:hypothetical protein KPH14_004536 [Odynerus spinipes]|uniref:Odorant receptor n=1 Tax=Odynerus spinipes TaxID=1348599 RepID=A0AAD9RLX6_9HYME|nr:hypothetical protein KPH14_004536 [Odynerus spinipes]